jgi:choline monooxygenase
MKTIEIDPDIRRAETLPGAAYGDPELHATVRERVFARAWHLVADTEAVKVPGQVHPTLLCDGMLDEPIVLTRDRDDRLHCLSNVCTHRAALVCEGPGVETQLRCRYHGRRFGLDGSFVSMPEFEAAENFPREADSLPRLRLERWRSFLFASLEPRIAFGEWIAELEARIGFLPIEEGRLDPAATRDYLVRANWALYIDNFLEGFHVPYVHAGLGARLDYSKYRTELHRWGNLQVGIAAGAEECFDFPAGHPNAGESGERVAALWFWLFPNTMWSVYPWGVSINVVQPLAPERTRVKFLQYVWAPAKLEQSAGNAIERVEREDEAVVESVQKGARSRLYKAGRYSPKREAGVHQFHRLLAEALED